MAQMNEDVSQSVGFLQDQLMVLQTRGVVATIVGTADPSRTLFAPDLSLMI